METAMERDIKNYIEENREQMMAELIGKTHSRNAREYAQRLMEPVYLMQKLQARDDMTILIANIWEKDT